LELPVTGTIRIRATHSTRASANVGAVLPGSDPDLKDEFVVFAAHLDHVGRGRPVNGDDIYNGAIDNASGVAEMLAMAEAVAELPERPRRSMLFLATTGEEIGGLGAKHFVANPPVPLSDVAAFVNVDGPTLMLFPVTGVNAMGGSHSTLGRVAATTATQLGLRITQSASPARAGDQGPFILRGVPSVWPIAEAGPDRTGVDEAARERELNRRIYHQPGDDLNRPLDFGAAVTMAMFDLLLGLQVAREPERPQWNRGDFFGYRLSPSGRP
jgi:Zn-dependent M28 family amino/carboxypeptidase